jgi:Tol biopolymer transport system component
VRLTNNAAADNRPAWSPDGTKIAFQSTRGDGVADDIFVMNADGTNVLRLTTDATPDQSPSWSSAGTKIAFSSSRTGNFEIFTMDPDGANKINITNNAGADTNPFYAGKAPDLLVWTSTRDGNPEIYAVGGSGIAVRLTNNTFVDDNASVK